MDFLRICVSVGGIWVAGIMFGVAGFGYPILFRIFSVCLFLFSWIYLMLCIEEKNRSSGDFILCIEEENRSSEVVK